MDMCLPLPWCDATNGTMRLVICCDEWHDVIYDYGAATCRVPLSVCRHLHISEYGSSAFIVRKKRAYVARLISSSDLHTTEKPNACLDATVSVHIPAIPLSETNDYIIVPTSHPRIAESVSVRIHTYDTKRKLKVGVSDNIGQSEDPRAGRARELKAEATTLLSRLWISPGCIVTRNTICPRNLIKSIEVLSITSKDGCHENEQSANANDVRSIASIPVFAIAARTRLIPCRPSSLNRHIVACTSINTETHVDMRNVPKSISNTSSPERMSVRERDRLSTRVGGMSEALQSLREVIQYPIKHAEMYETLNVTGIGGVLLSGPPGVGKTMLLNIVCEEFEANLIAVDGPSIYSPYFGESESNLRKLFDKAQVSAQRQSTVLFIDELDAMCPNRETSNNEERRVVATLLTLLDGLKRRAGNLVVIGATNRPNTIDPALRRPGRFDREVCIAVPTVAERRDILRVHTSVLPLCASVDLDNVAIETRGFVGADIAALCREAAFNAMKRLASGGDGSISKHSEKSDMSEGVREDMENVTGMGAGTEGTVYLVSAEDFDTALTRTVASAQREVVIVGLETKTWDSIGGVDVIKARMQELIEWPIRYGDSYGRLGLTPTRGVLLYGPPGCSKTSLAKAVAGSTHCSFLALSGAQVYSSFVGEAEKIIRDTFRRARENAPAVLFLDEIDSLVGNREVSGASDGVSNRILSTLLNELDGMEDSGHVVCVAATNRPEMLDSALLRPGRLGNLIYVPPPSEEARAQIFAIHTKAMTLAPDIDLGSLANMTPGFTGAEIEGLCREAALSALRADITATHVAMEHFIGALPLFMGNVHDTTLYEKFSASR
eukprot:CFRG7369T1